MIAGGVGSPPPGASAGPTAPMRSSCSGAAMAVQPPKLCPTIPIRPASTSPRFDHLVDQEPDVRHPRRDPALPGPLEAFRRGRRSGRRERRVDDLGMIERAATT